jgi:ketosteroid isomerase-like protein
MNKSADSAARAFVRAINRQDVDALAELMTPEFRFVDSLGNLVEGRDKMPRILRCSRITSLPSRRATAMGL